MSYEDQIKNEYFEWLYDYACKGKVNNRISYRKLFMLLHSIDLRNRFATIKKDPEITDILDEPCSVLEMILALAIRCEETIMDNPKYGDRTGQWFWSMLSNLGLSMMTDDNYDEKIATKIIYDFMERRYQPDGKGGLFYIRDCPQDLRDVEIWMQLCWYLDKFN